MAQTKRLLSCVILIGVLALQAAAAPKAKPKVAKPASKPAIRNVNALPGAAVALPSGCKVNVRWVCPPLSTNAVKESHWYDVHFVVDSSGRPWFGTDATSIVNPTQCYMFELQRVYGDMACLENGAFLLASMSDLGFVTPPEKPMTDDKGIPQVGFQPISSLPLPDCRLYPGAGNVLYLVGWNPASRKNEVYVLKRDKLSSQSSAVREYVKVMSSEDSIAAVAGDGDTTYVAIDRVILRTSRASSTPAKVFVHPTEMIMGLAYSPQAGLFYASSNGVGRIGAKGTMQILAADDTAIYLQKGTLYVFFEKSLGVLAFDGVADLKRFDLPIKNVPATQSKEVKVTDIRTFEAGETAPDYAERKYAKEFDKATTRFIYCQIDMTNVLKAKHKQVVSMELDWPGERGYVDSSETNMDFGPNSTTAWATMRFGSTEAGSLYPGVYTLKTYLNGSKIDERHLTVKGEANILEAAWNSDSARMWKLLEDGADPNVTNADGASPLVMAVDSGSMENVRLLLDHKADIEAKNADGNTPLLMTADRYGDNSAMVKLLLEHGANVNATGKGGETALYLAARNQQLETIRALLDHKADANALNKDGSPPLLALTYHMPGTQYQAKPEIVEMLIKGGADPNAAEKNGSTALAEAISGPDLALVQCLVDNGADINKEYRYSDGTAHSLLYHAILSRDIESDRLHREELRKIVKLLSDKGAELRSDEVSYILSTDSHLLLSRKQIVAALDSSNQAVWQFKPTDPWLRKYLLKRMIGYAYGDVSIARDVSGYKDALSCAVFAKDRAEEWGMAAEVPDVYFDCGILAVKTGDTTTAKMYFSKYLELVPTGVNADKARAMIAGF